MSDLDDDDYRATAVGAMIALVAQIDRAPHRTAALETAREIRALLARADKILKQPGETDELHDMAEAARDRIVKSMGTAAWDEPESPKIPPLPAAPGPGVLDRVNERLPPPLTDEQLDEVEAALHWKAAEGGDLEPPIVSAKLALQLVAELRRLRTLETNTIHVAFDADEEILRLPPGQVIPAKLTPVERELQRLQSDEWLRAGAQEIMRYVPNTLTRDIALVEIVNTLRKHRDGKA